MRIEDAGERDGDLPGGLPDGFTGGLAGGLIRFRLLWARRWLGVGSSGPAGVRIWWRLAAGIYAAATAASLLGRAPIVGRQSWTQLVERGVLLVGVAALTGAAVSWLLLRREVSATERVDFPFGQVVLYCGVGWVLAAPAALLLERESHWAPLMMGLGAVATAFALHGLAMTAKSERQTGKEEQVQAWAPGGLFLLLPAGGGGIWLALGMAACLEGAAIPFETGRLFVAGLLLAGAAFVFAWRWAAARAAQGASSGRAGLRLAGMCLLAIVASMMAVMMQLPEDASGGSGAAANEAAQVSAAKAKDGTASSGYKGIILWTPPKKRERIVAPRLLSAGELEELKRKPVVIPFDGVYWYFQEPHTSPGRDPHVAHGDPALVNIRSVNQVPLMMEAHQKLSNSIALSCCRAIRVDLRNGDNEMGPIVLGVVLADSRGKGSMALAGEKVPTSEPERFVEKKSAVTDAVQFVIPERRGIERFDEITVVYFPEEQRSGVGTKIGIEDFVLLPR